MFKAGEIIRHKPTGDIGVVIVAREGMIRQANRNDITAHCLGGDMEPWPDTYPLNEGDLCVLRRGQLHLIVYQFRWEVIG